MVISPESKLGKVISMNADNSIEDYSEIVTENPYKEIWNQLYYFTDIEDVNNKIRARFDLEKGNHKENTRKQAQQMAYSITQADNYFRAAQEVDISVKPNLIYYGISSLANTVILYNNDGTFSLDYLRDKKREEHHGLEKKFSLKESGSVKEILESISCEVYHKSGKPYGHFKNFYNSIPPECVFVEKKITSNGALVTRIAMQSIVKKQIGDLDKASFDLLTMFKFLPDMAAQLEYNNIEINLCSGKIIYEVNIDQENIDTAMDAENHQKRVRIDILIDQLSEEKKAYFKKMMLRNKAVHLKHEFPNNLHFKHDSRQGSDMEYPPGMTQDLFGTIYFICQAEDYIQELANFYICFFCTGMLCRYYPDYWMSWLEKNVGFRHLMDSLCSIAIRKFPNLILNQLTRRINHFHV